MDEDLWGVIVGPVQTDHDAAAHMREVLALQPASQAVTPVDPGQTLAVDEVFAQEARARESSAVVSLLSILGSSALLADLAKEHFHLPAGEEERPRRGREPNEREDGR